MKITDILKQKKEGRYNIYLDGEFAFGAFKETIYKFGLRVNDELEEKRLKEILEYEEYLKAQRVAYKYLSYKNRTSKELIHRLKKSQISPSIIDKVLVSLTKQGLIDDKNYTKIFIENKKSVKPIGTKLIKRKLKEKGIDDKIINEHLSKIYPETEEAIAAKQVLLKYLKTLKEVNTHKKKQKCFRYLSSKGFDTEIIMDLLREYFNNSDESPQD